MSSNSTGNRRKGRVSNGVEKAAACMLLIGHKKRPKDFEPFQTRPEEAPRCCLTPQISGEKCEQKKTAVNKS